MTAYAGLWGITGRGRSLNYRSHDARWLKGNVSYTTSYLSIKWEQHHSPHLTLRELVLFSLCLCSFLVSVFGNSFVESVRKSAHFFRSWWSFQLEQTRLFSTLSHPDRTHVFFPPLASPRWLSVLPPNCTWSAPYLSTGFKLAVGILSMNTEDRGQWQSHSTHTQTHKLLVSVHLSFDNKNTSLKLSGEHKTERKGSGIMLHVLWEAWLIQTIIMLIYFSLMKNTSHCISTWGNKQPRESSCAEHSAVCLCISSCQITAGSVLGFCYYPRINLLESNIHRNIKAVMICMFYLSTCKICKLRPALNLCNSLNKRVNILCLRNR